MINFMTLLDQKVLVSSICPLKFPVEQIVLINKHGFGMISSTQRFAFFVNFKSSIVFHSHAGITKQLSSGRKEQTRMIEPL